MRHDTGEILDLSRTADLQAGIIRAIGEPERTGVSKRQNAHVACGALREAIDLN